MKITVLYNRVTSLSHGRKEDILADIDTVNTANVVAKALTTLGHTIDLFELNEKTVPLLNTHDTEFFFNNAFGIGDADKSESEIPGLLDQTKKPYSGSGQRAIILTTNKLATKEVLRANDLPTPGSKNFPLIVKPSNEDCSIGISASSVVTTEEDLRNQIKLLKETYEEPVLVEEYIAGRELNITVLGNGNSAKALPISEIVFGPSFDHKYKIVDFNAKWEEKSGEYLETNGFCPADLPDDLTKEIQIMAVRAVMATNCLDCTRVDFRLDEKLRPYILEVNANPAVGPGDGATRSAKVAGYSYPEFLQEIINAALSRFKV